MILDFVRAITCAMLFAAACHSLDAVIVLPVHHRTPVSLTHRVAPLFCHRIATVYACLPLYLLPWWFRTVQVRDRTDAATWR